MPSVIIVIGFYVVAIFVVQFIIVRNSTSGTYVRVDKIFVDALFRNFRRCTYLNFLLLVTPFLSMHDENEKSQKIVVSIKILINHYF